MRKILASTMIQSPRLVLIGRLLFKFGIHMPNILRFWISKFISIPFSFKMSPRMLILVKNWHIYIIILVHSLFSTVFHSFNSISVSSWPINMFLNLFSYINNFLKNAYFLMKQSFLNKSIFLLSIFKIWKWLNKFQTYYILFKSEIFSTGTTLNLLNFGGHKLVIFCIFIMYLLW